MNSYLFKRKKENCIYNYLLTDEISFFFHQFLAVTVEMMLLFQFGQCISFTGVVNAALSGRFNQNETLQLTDEESSWFGSMVYACQPFGSMLSMITTGMRILMI